MSRPTVEEWLQRYYPKEACETLKEDALEHSIRKWEGLLHENLPDGFEPPVEVDAETCALCYHYTEEYPEEPPVASGDNWIEFERDCLECPLCKVRGNVRCYQDLPNELSPFQAYNLLGDPEPMLEWLKKAKEI